MIGKAYAKGLKPAKTHKDNHRGGKEAVHLGFWEQYAREPRITKDTQVQNPEVDTEVAAVLGVLQDIVAPKLNALLWRHDKEQYMNRQWSV